MTVALETAAKAARTAALLPVYRSYEPVLMGGSGVRVIDDAGREYIDFASGIGVNALGYGDEGIAAAIQGALETGLIHTSNLFRTEPAGALAERLVGLSFADRVFFCNSGGEANEGAFKFARRYGRSVGGAAKHEIVALQSSFHGRLFGSLAATWREAFRTPFEPLMPGVHFVAPEDEAALRAVVSRARTAAIIAEPVQGEGGLKPLSPEYLKLLRSIADEVDAVLIFDEVQCGYGRTGKLFAHEHAGVTPDVMTLSKAIAGGLPMGAILVNERVATAVQPGDHATTFGGGPLVASVANYVLERIANSDFLAEVARKGALLEQLLNGLTQLPRVKQVRGIGLMWGIEVEGEAAPVIAALLEAGVITTAAGPNVVRLLPPLVISDADLAFGVAKVHEVLQ